MANTQNIQEHMAVVGSCGTHVGTVDHVQGDTIKLTRNDPAAGGVHHTIPASWVASVDTQVKLNKSGADAMKEWQTA